jgi:hypothetical protein
MRSPACARSTPRSITVWRRTNSTPGGSASAGAVAMLKAWPSTRCAAATRLAGRRSVDLGNTIALAASGTPRSSMPVVSWIPPPAAASPVNELNVT